MREKLSVEQFDKLFNDYVESANLLYEEYKKHMDTNKYKKLDLDLGKLFIKKLLSYDLSNIPCEKYNFGLDSETTDIYDFSNTNANLDFGILHIDYRAKYNFKSCNIRNLDRLDINFLKANIDSFDEKTIKEYSYLFEELGVIEINTIKIKYLKTEEGKKKALELAKYLEENSDLFSDIPEIQILNSASNYTNGVININIKDSIIKEFRNLLMMNNEYFKKIFFIIEHSKNKNQDELIDLKIRVLDEFNRYFNNRNYEVFDQYILDLLYIEKDYKILKEYLKNKNIEPIIDKYFSIIFNEIVNYYYNNINDSLLFNNFDLIDNFISKFDFNIFLDESINDIKSNFSDKISDEDILNITRKILKFIDNTGELLEIFNKKLEENKIILYSDKNDYPEFFKKDDINDSFYSPNRDTILCYNENDYDTIVALIHEFFHMYSHFKGKNTFKDNPYIQEIASIFFENIAIDYLSNTFLVDKEKFKITKERKIFNNDYIYELKRHLELLKIKRERDLVINDFYSGKDMMDSLFKMLMPQGEVLESLFKKDKYNNEKNAYKNIGFIIRGIYYKNFDLLNRKEKVLISYILGTELSKTCVDNHRFIELFLFIAKNSESNNYSENNLFKIIIDTISKYEEENIIESRTIK